MDYQDKRWEELREMARNEDKHWAFPLTILWRRYKWMFLGMAVIILWLLSSLLDERDKRLSLENTIFTLSNAVLRESCLVGPDRPVGLIMAADSPLKLYDALRDAAALADGQRTAMLAARSHK